jgi:archaellum component FlaC
MMGLWLANGRGSSSKLSTILWSSLAVGTLTLTGCGSPVENTAAPAAKTVDAEAPPAMSSPASADKLTQTANNQPSVGKTEAKPLMPLPQKPQLIRTADVSLRLESIDKMVIQLRRIVQSKQGDIYNFQDDRPQEPGQRRQASLILKVPSPLLDDTLAEITKLGQIQGQTIKSDDVTQQLVDSTARLKNLRQQEELTRKIMERSGSIKDVLAVSQTLSEIREQIEQLDATAKNLRQQVAYSTINLKVEEIQSANPAGDGIGVQVTETWKNSTRAAGGLATNLGLLLLWLVPFTPFLALGAGGFYYYSRRRSAPPVVEAPSEE